MKYEGPIIRPPSEANSLLLQVTVGCSHNKCTFCPAYKQKKFRIKSLEEINEDILVASNYHHYNKIFLCDGDAMIIPQGKLIKILMEIRKNIKGIKRIGTYANTKSLLRKDVKELSQLKELGMGIIYLGLETGSAELLKKINKGVTPEQMVEVASRVKQAKIQLSVTVILGLGGNEQSTEHAKRTAEILSKMDPDFASALTLMIMPGTPIYEDYINGKFSLPPINTLLNELLLIVEHSNFSNCYFTSNHASNYLPIKAYLPTEKVNVVNTISHIINSGDKRNLRPEFLRGL